MWKPYIDCADYEVSDLGEVRRVHRVYRGRQVPYALGQRVGNSGYLHVSISIGGIARNVLVHRMVLRTFSGEAPDGFHGCHLDGDRLNNRLLNLRWASAAENEADKRAHGTAWNPRKLVEADVIEMRRLYRDCDASFRSIAQQFGVSAPTAHGVIVGKYWPHVPGAVAAKSKGRKTAYVSACNEDVDIRC